MTGRCRNRPTPSALLVCLSAGVIALAGCNLSQAPAGNSTASPANEPGPATVAPQGTGEPLVLVGTYTGTDSQGIYAFRFDDESGALAPLGLAAETPSPSFLTASADGRFVFAVNETATWNGQPTGSVSSFEADRETGRLAALSMVASGGAHPCHLALDSTGRFLAVANYSGTFAMLPVSDDGLLNPPAIHTNTGSGPNRTRQTGPHAHAVVFDAANRFLLGVDLGIDRILVYRFDESTGAIAPHQPASVSVTPGAGPRHLAFHPSRPFAFVINELSSSVDAFKWDEANGRLEAHGNYSTVPGGYSGQNATAEIALHPDGRFLYGSNRGHDSIAVFAVTGDGQLTPVEHVSTRGKTPRNFTIDPTGRWLIAGNQESNTLAVFALDPQTGRLTPTGPLTTVGAPVSVLFLP